MTLENERKLVRKAQRDPKHFGKIYSHYHPRIRVFVLKKVSDDEIADDVTSMVFEKAIKNLSSFQWQGISFGSWLYRIARNTVYDYYRSAKRKRTSQLTDTVQEGLSDDVSLEEDVLHDEQELKLYALIAKLEKKDQYLLYYRYFEGLSIREVSARVELSEANVATRLHRIREKLKVFETEG